MKTSAHRRFLNKTVVGTMVMVLVAMPFLSNARELSGATSVNIVNNSSRTITHVFLSPVSVDDWSADQLSSPIGAGQSRDLNNLACSQGEVKVIAEDNEGCFAAKIISCDDASTWTLTNETSRDCGAE